MGFDCAKKHIEALRKYSLFVIENDKSVEGDFRIGCIRIMIRVEDEDRLENWTKYVSETFYMSLPSIMTSRFDYRSEVTNYNKQIQQNIYNTLTEMFLRDFCKRDEKTYKNASSRAEGQKIILKIIDVMRDPTEEIDAWIGDRAFAFVRLAGGLVGSGEIEEGFEALEKGVNLYVKIRNLPIGTVLKFNCPSLDLISITVDENLQKLNMQTIEPILTNSKGWEWFNPIRETERFKNLISKVKQCCDFQ